MSVLSDQVMFSADELPACTRAQLVELNMNLSRQLLAYEAGSDQYMNEVNRIHADVQRRLEALSKLSGQGVCWEKASREELGVAPVVPRSSANVKDAVTEAFAAYVVACHEEDGASVATPGAAANAWYAWLRIFQTTPTTDTGAMFLLAQLDALGDELPASHATLAWATPAIVSVIESGLEQCNLKELRAALAAIQEAMARDVAAGHWCGHIALGVESFTRFAIRPQLVTFPLMQRDQI